jgi:hypothetical protein
MLKKKLTDEHDSTQLKHALEQVTQFAAGDFA